MDLSSKYPHHHVASATSVAYIHPGCRAVANAMCATQGLGQKDASLTGILDSPEQSPPTSGTHFGSMISLSTCKGCKPGSCEVLKIHLVRLHGMWSIGNLNFRTSSLVLSWDGDSAARDWCCSVNMEETAQHPSTKQKLSDDLAKPFMQNYQCDYLPKLYLDTPTPTITIAAMGARLTKKWEAMFHRV